MKPMKLEGALKLYMALYFLAFLFTFLMSIPMLKHVLPKNECLLFVEETHAKGKPSFQYGNPGGCMAAGFLPLLVCVGALGLMFVQWLQLRKLNKHLDNPKVSSDEYRAEARATFWKMIWFHCGIGSIVLIVAFILTAGYTITCRNMYLVVERNLRATIHHTPNINQGQTKVYETFADQAQILRYNTRNTDVLGRNKADLSITCRSLLTDSRNTFSLLENQADNNQYAQYYGFWNNQGSGQSNNAFLADVGNFEHKTSTDNLLLEVSMAGAWISTLIWVIILLLMIKERHHLRAHLTDESMWGGGSEYGPGSVRSGRSRKTSTSERNIMTPIDFDVRSNASRMSRASRSSKGTSYKDMGVNKNKGSSSYKSMGSSSKPKSSVPSRLTVSRLEQVPSLPQGNMVKKLLAGDDSLPLNDTMSLASGYSTVTGQVFGPRASVIQRPNGQGSPGTQQGGLMDYFSTPQPGLNEAPGFGQINPISETTGESEEL